jgi:hypothetical protein
MPARAAVDQTTARTTRKPYGRNDMKIWEITGENLAVLLDELGADPTIAESIRIVRIADDEGDVKVKVNEGTWTWGLASLR